MSDMGRVTSDEGQTPRISAWVRAHTGKMLFPKAVCELIEIADGLERELAGMTAKQHRTEKMLQAAAMHHMRAHEALQGLCDALVARMTADDASARVVPLLEAHRRAVGVLEDAKRAAAEAGGAPGEVGG